MVAGLIRKEGKVLLGQRPIGDTFEGKWEFPGGKIEFGESPEVALRRELDEELGVQADIGRLLLATTHSYGSSGLVLIFYEVLFWKGQLKPVHHMDLKWVAIQELKAQPLPEANLKVIDRLVAALG